MSTSQIEAGKANLAPYHWKPGQSGNPSGMPKGTPSLTRAYAKILALSPDDLKRFKPENHAEVIALRQVKRAITSNLDYGNTANAVAKEIADRLEGKALQRRADVTTDEVVSKAKLAYELGLRLRDNLVAHCKEIACDEACAQRISTLIPFDSADVLQAVLSTVEEQYHEAVVRELGGE